jgi:sirohydrochlorin ferrochelatase
MDEKALQSELAVAKELLDRLEAELNKLNSEGDAVLELLANADNADLIGETKRIQERIAKLLDDGAAGSG